MIMEETNEQPTLVKHAIRWGLIAGGVSIGITALLYIIDYTMMVQLKTALLMFVVYLGVIIYGGIDYRKTVGGFLPYGKAWTHGFVAFAISGLVATAFNMILYHVIDPELPQKLVDASIENTRAMMENFGASGDAVDQALAQAKENTAKQFTASGQALSYLIMIGVSAVLALISALFVRKNVPVEG
jgi:hypothetical protein